MAQDKNEFLKRLLATFRLEAEEHLKTMSSVLSEIEKGALPAERAAHVESMFRAAHSLKGAARAVNRKDVETLCQSLESVFAALKAGRLESTEGVIELVYQAIDTLTTGLPAEHSEAHTVGDPALLQRLDAASRGTPPGPRPASGTATNAEEPPGQDSHGTHWTPPSPATEAPGKGSQVALSPAPAALRGAETVRIPAARLDAVMRQADELLGPRLAADRRVAELTAINEQLQRWNRERRKVAPMLRTLTRDLGCETGEVRVEASRSALIRLLEWLEREAAMAKSLRAQLAATTAFAARDRRALDALAESLLGQVRDMQLLPVSALLEGFPRYARGLARERSKQVEVSVEGGDIEVDRRILDEIRDPLIHLLRNCVDHGIEIPVVRERTGKAPQGRIAFVVSQQHAGKVEIAVSDDGAGIERGKLVMAARKLGVLREDETPNETLALDLIFHSGLTTSEVVTDVSGRGLGLAIVRDKIERLGGAIEVTSEPGAGTAFRIELPLAWATYRGILVETGSQRFALPTTNVERVARVPREAVKTVEGKPSVSLSGQVFALVRLDDVLDLPRSGEPEQAARFIHVVVLSLGSSRIALQVDGISGEQELLVKPLGPQLVRVRNVAGASTLGSGELVPVLSVADLLKSAVRGAGAATAAVAPSLAALRQRSILVVEDSITSRALLKNILEAAGYHVVTAVDGIDGLTALRSADFDLLVSDVEMPRMDGYELTAKVRADARLSELPVVLVTALGSREQRERGIEVGANAYLVKSSFEQSDLLETVRRLL